LTDKPEKMEGAAMIIQDSHINQKSAHHLNMEHKETIYRKERIVPMDRNAVQVSITNEAQIMAESRAFSAASLVKNTPDNISMENNAPLEEVTPESREKTKLDILLKTMEKITGKKFHFSKTTFTLHKKPESDTVAPHPDNAPAPPSDTAGNDPAETENRMRQIETYTERTHYERETADVAISGFVKTADGREIALDVALNMSREYYEENSEYTLTTVPLTDPLVINYDGSAADLTEEKYLFDLNADGSDEMISFITPGTGGFLVLDRNRDGVVNNGSELFGTTSGNGFAELAGYDDDRNGWIDAGDSVYYDLSVWEKSETGKDRLIALADTGIGAIYLDAANSPFRITDSDNQTLGQARATSVYLMEDGGTGTVQQIDLAT
jgi:hypothetical protein